VFRAPWALTRASRPPGPRSGHRPPKGETRRFGDLPDGQCREVGMGVDPRTRWPSPEGQLGQLFLGRLGRRIPFSTCEAYPRTPAPGEPGVASMRWVRPDFTTGSNSEPSPGGPGPGFLQRRDGPPRTNVRRAATWMAVGITSFEDCPKFTWSLGWTAPVPSRATVRQAATTSLVFMLEDVPDPVW
jgi:hypothetical protein